MPSAKLSTAIAMSVNGVNVLTIQTSRGIE